MKTGRGTTMRSLVSSTAVLVAAVIPWLVLGVVALAGCGGAGDGSGVSELVSPTEPTRDVESPTAQGSESGLPQAPSAGPSVGVDTPARTELRQDLTDTVCDESGVPRFVRNLQPVRAFDFAALRASDGVSFVRILDEVGTPCVTQEQACFDQLRRPFNRGYSFPESVISFPESIVDIALTRGSEVELLTAGDEILDALVPIDTPGEAALQAFFAYYNLDCRGPNVSAVDGGYLVYAETGIACEDFFRGCLLFVSSEGGVEVQRCEVVVEELPNCDTL